MCPRVTRKKPAKWENGGLLVALPAWGRGSAGVASPQGVVGGRDALSLYAIRERNARLDTTLCGRDTNCVSMLCHSLWVWKCQRCWTASPRNRSADCMAKLLVAVLSLILICQTAGAQSITEAEALAGYCFGVLKHKVPLAKRVLASMSCDDLQCGNSREQLRRSIVDDEVKLARLRRFLLQAFPPSRAWDSNEALLIAAEVGAGDAKQCPGEREYLPEVADCAPLRRCEDLSQLPF